MCPTAIVLIGGGIVAAIGSGIFNLISPNSKKDQLAQKYYSKNYWQLCSTRKRTIRSLIK